MQPSELRQLLRKYMDHTITAQEFNLLWETLQEKHAEPAWNAIIEEALTDTGLHGYSDPADAKKRLAHIQSVIDIGSTENEAEQYREQESFTSSSSRSVPIFKKALRYAAIIILLLSPLAYFLLHKSSADAAISVAATTEPSTEPIKPGTQKALLTLADGTVIVLDSMANGKIAQQGNANVIKLANGQVKYLAENGSEEVKPVINKMSTPRGGQYQLTLPDGSVVWLNAESSVTYPAVFAGNERRVSITGEVYFEVAKDKTKPFRVTAGDQEIEVLGTHFNINAYADEASVKTSLLEGSVKVNKALLKPGEAFMNGKVGATDVDQDVAWKNGVFNFNNQTLSHVMRQLSRWYNIEVMYPAGVPKKEYGGEIGRNLTLEQVLKGLEQTGVQFQLDGRKLIVKS